MVYHSPQRAVRDGGLTEARTEDDLSQRPIESFLVNEGNSAAIFTDLGPLTRFTLPYLAIWRQLSVKVGTVIDQTHMDLHI